MPADVVLGWDIGGAHLKVAAADRKGRVVQAVQLPCPLWLGLEHLDHAISLALGEMPRARLHAVTMTGELTDFFRNRDQGVKSIIARFAKQVPVDRTFIYAGPAGFLTPRHAEQKTDAVASANWAASAQLVARLLPDALFVDVGSTTTDLVPIRGGLLIIRGFSDADRLACEELVYTGVVRTPIMALADRIPFDGQWIPAMAEYFATTADVYRLTGELPEGADQLPAADNGGKTVRDSARRLARMIGRDLESAPLAQMEAVRPPPGRPAVVADPPGLRARIVTGRCRRSQSGGGSGHGQVRRQKTRRSTRQALSRFRLADRCGTGRGIVGVELCARRGRRAPGAKAQT